MQLRLWSSCCRPRHRSQWTWSTPVPNSRSLPVGIGRLYSEALWRLTFSDPLRTWLAEVLCIGIYKAQPTGVIIGVVSHYRALCDSFILYPWLFCRDVPASKAHAKNQESGENNFTESRSVVTLISVWRGNERPMLKKSDRTRTEAAYVFPTYFKQGRPALMKSKRLKTSRADGCFHARSRIDICFRWEKVGEKR